MNKFVEYLVKVLTAMFAVMDGCVYGQDYRRVHGQDHGQAHRQDHRCAQEE